MTKLYRHKKSCNVYPEFAGSPTQADFPKLWELVETNEPTTGVSAPSVADPAPAPALVEVSELVAGGAVLAEPTEAVAPRPQGSKSPKAK